jgi:hypothetical protein
MRAGPATGSVESCGLGRPRPSSESPLWRGVPIPPLEVEIRAYAQLSPTGDATAIATHGGCCARVLSSAGGRVLSAAGRGGH